MIELRKPRRLREGSVLGIIGPCSPLPDIGKLEPTVERLELENYTAWRRSVSQGHGN